MIDYFDSLPPVSRALDKPLRMPVVDRYKVNKQYFYSDTLVLKSGERSGSVVECFTGVTALWSLILV